VTIRLKREQLSSLKERGRVKGGYQGVWGIGGRA
jgi:hypothetical protein